MAMMSSKLKKIAIAVILFIAVIALLFKVKKESYMEKLFQFIKSVEGLRLYAYQDSKGVWTIGYGSTVVNGQKVVKGMVISENQAYESLIDWFKKNKMVYPRKNLNDNQRVALSSFAYNIGLNGYKKSAVYAYLRDTKPSLIDNQHLYDLFLLYDNYHDKQGHLVHSDGLENRRKKE